ncbi:hypothetical protein PABG_05320 [Paracoccidioides brasiliensis Pb03]|nr:hypothetical protein PABG_05320 [Paracoccidioides brasiliensis Pb03]
MCRFAVALIYYSIISSLQSPQASALGLIAQIQLRQIPGLPEPSRDDPTSHHKLSAHQPSSLRLQDVDHNFDNELLRRVFNAHTPCLAGSYSQTQEIIKDSTVALFMYADQWLPKYNKVNILRTSI